MDSYRMYVDGAWVDAADGRSFTSNDPWTLQDWAEIPEGDERDVDRAVSAAGRAFEESWWRHDARRRGAVLRRFADLVETSAERIAEVESRDNGKALTEERAACAAIPAYFRHAPALAESYPDSAPRGGDPNVRAVTHRVPYGVIGIQTPWNTPGQLLSQSAAPALAAGNTIVVKPSEVAPCSTLELARLVEEAGFPAGVVNVVTGFGQVVGAALCAHPRVAKLAFTGSTQGGVLVAEHAARRLVPVVMELGGKSANIVFTDCDLDRTVDALVRGFTVASGQTCMAGSRVLVERPIHDLVLDRMLDAAAKVRIGDPRDPATAMGPIATEAQLAKIRQFVAIGVEEGGRVRCGGGPPEGAEHPRFFAPTVFTDVTNDMTICQEEIFGPVCAVMPFDTEEAAVRIANDTRYGLSGAVWTSDLARAHRVTDAIRAGVVWVNDQRAGDPAFATGGTAMSGYGRLSGVEGHHEMTQVKSVQMRIA
ncbi:aldehyde dehydrogenase family protein [Pseudonocardia sp. CA-107938]|uniref:aldehyde dehydrogenase family protein n=1 Tax=Pseudonocardia sp. CA-107938 TaxID=3240021 RepID=UPI003D9395A2